MGSNKSEGTTIDRIVFGRKIRNLRKIKGWTQKELAEKLDYTEAMISHIETGKSYMDQDKIVATAKEFDIPNHVLMDNDGFTTKEELEDVVNLRRHQKKNSEHLQTIRLLLKS